MKKFNDFIDRYLWLLLAIVVCLLIALAIGGRKVPYRPESPLPSRSFGIPTGERHET